MRLKFLEFLKRNRAFASFYANVLEKNSRVFRSYQSLLQQFLIEEVKPQYWVQAAFKWNETKDFDFWYDLDDKWRKELKIMQN